MKYKSTRGSVTDITFQQALFSGFLSDGGILMPETIPDISSEQLRGWKNLSYMELAKKIIVMFVDETEIPGEHLDQLLETAYSKFAHPDIAPIVSLKSGINIMELFHGKTWSFKDLALSCIGQFLQYFLNRDNKHVTILVGTTGDTGSAAIEAVRGLSSVDMIVMYPDGRVSEVQERQMISVLDDNVHVFNVEGTADDIDIFIKPCFLDTEFAGEHNLCSINSINWARIMIQMVHYFHAYLQLCDEDCSDEVQIIIPTGACGNVTSGIVAQKMGLPIKLVCAVNSNDIVHRMLSGGVFSVGESLPTIAPAMDVQIPYNMERIWYLVSDRDTELVSDLMKQFEKFNSVSLPPTLLDQLRQTITQSCVVPDQDIRESLKRVWDEDAYLLCPHTATGVHLHHHHSSASPQKSVVLATASVMKFEKAVLEAGVVFPEFEKVSELMKSESRCLNMRKGENWESILRLKIEEISHNVLKR